MNLLLLYDEDFVSEGEVELRGERARHAREVLGATAGDQLRVGRLGGDVGAAEVGEDDGEVLGLSVTLNVSPPPRPGIDLILAMPRPKALRRLLPALASMGVDRVVLTNAARVEKSYFDSKVLAAESVARLFDLGLEQGRDTVRPTLSLARRFRPFVEDELDALVGVRAARFVAHPSAEGASFERSRESERRLLLAVGPEGGWVPFELSLLEEHRFRPVSLGFRPLRTEIAVPALLGASGRLRPG
jgi:RsmE family RNA methyltransferase